MLNPTIVPSNGRLAEGSRLAESSRSSVAVLLILKTKVIGRIKVNTEPFADHAQQPGASETVVVKKQPRRPHDGIFAHFYHGVDPFSAPKKLMRHGTIPLPSIYRPPSS